MEATIRVRTLVNYAVAMLAAAVATLVVMWAMSADAAPGDADTTFVPITPCRLIDTRAASRIGAFPTFGPEQTRTLQAHGTNGQCTLPTQAVALSLNITALDATTNTFITAWPNGTRPNSSSLNPQPGVRAFNAVTVKLDSGEFRLFNKAGGVDLIVDVNGYYTKSSLRDIADRLAELEAKTAAMSTTTLDGQPVVRFTGVNVQVVSGSGATEGTANGRGNLIVGYHESDDTPEDRSGSHNLIVGSGHSYAGYGGLVAGFDNYVAGKFNSVTGGTQNTAFFDFSSVTGGRSNLAFSEGATVSGGTSNSALGTYSTVSGGSARTASDNYSWRAGTYTSPN